MPLLSGEQHHGLKSKHGGSAARTHPAPRSTRAHLVSPLLLASFLQPGLARPPTGVLGWDALREFLLPQEFCDSQRLGHLWRKGAQGGSTSPAEFQDRGSLGSPAGQRGALNTDRHEDAHEVHRNS